MSEVKGVDLKKTWYFVRPKSKLDDILNILHLPYTGMVLCFVIIGALLANIIYLDRILATIIAYFIGLGIGVHSLDQLEPKGSHYVNYLTRSELKVLALTSLSVACGIGLYFALVVSLGLIPLIAMELFFSLAYSLPSYFFNGVLHTRLAFVFSWGFLPYLTSYFVNEAKVNILTVLLGIPIMLASWYELTWSRKARKLRISNSDPTSYKGEERKLKILVATVYIVTFVDLVSTLLLKRSVIS